jgi:hypothetical protein
MIRRAEVYVRVILASKRVGQQREQSNKHIQLNCMLKIHHAYPMWKINAVDAYRERSFECSLEFWYNLTFTTPKLAQSLCHVLFSLQYDHKTHYTQHCSLHPRVFAEHDCHVTNAWDVPNDIPNDVCGAI